MSQFKDINPHQFSELRATQLNSILLDVRTPAEFAGVHAEGALNIPLNILNSSTISSHHQLQKDAPIYLLCEKGTRAKLAAALFLDAGFTNIHVIEGGTQAWITAALPIVSSGKKSISIERQVRIGAGILILLGILLSLTMHSGFLALSAFVGTGLVFAGVADWCGMGLLLAKAPWNR
jgi:rhodanese-related sulfurtransferase